MSEKETTKPVKRRGKAFKASEEQLKYCLVYAENPQLSRRQVAEKSGVSLERVTKWYEMQAFQRWMLDTTKDRIDQVVMAAASRRVSVDMMRDGKSGSDAALKIYLEGFKADAAMKLEGTKTSNNPMAVILQIGSEGVGDLHPAAQIIEAQISRAKEEAEDAVFDAKKPRQHAKKKPKKKMDD